MVPVAGLEPAWIAPPHFECGASANFATPAWEQLYSMAPCISRADFRPVDADKALRGRLYQAGRGGGAAGDVGVDAAARALVRGDDEPAAALEAQAAQTALARELVEALAQAPELVEVELLPLALGHEPPREALAPAVAQLHVRAHRRSRHRREHEAPRVAERKVPVRALREVRLAAPVRGNLRQLRRALPDLQRVSEQRIGKGAARRAAPPEAERPALVQAACVRIEN